MVYQDKTKLYYPCKEDLEVIVRMTQRVGGAQYKLLSGMRILTIKMSFNSYSVKMNS